MATTLVQISGQGPIGPQGEPGVTTILYEDEMPYAKRLDVVNDNLIYQGEATPGVINSVAGWRIKKMIIGEDGDVDTLWADGNANFDNVWNDRASLTYI